MNELDELSEVENVNMYTIPGQMIVIEIPKSILPIGDDGVVKITNKTMANNIVGYVNSFLSLKYITLGARVLGETIVDYIERHRDEI